MEDQNPQGPVGITNRPVDLSDHAKHLRFIHFSVTVIGSLLLFAGFFNPAGKAQKAFEDIQRVITMAAKLKEGLWTREVVESVVKKRRERQKVFVDPAKRLDLQLKDDTVFRATIGTGWFLSDSDGRVTPFIAPIPLEYRDDRAEVSSGRRDEKTPRHRLDDAHDVASRQFRVESLEKFVRVWDFLYLNPYVNVPEILLEGRIFSDGTADAFSTYSGAVNERPREAELRLDYLTATLRLVPIEVLRADIESRMRQPLGLKISHGQQIIDFLKESQRLNGCVFVSEALVAVKHVVAMNADCERVELDFQRTLLAQAGGVVKGGTFDIVFPELDELAKKIRYLPLYDLQQHLYSEVQRSGPTISYFGANIGLNEFARFGAIILIVIQVYFLLHLRDFQLRITKDNSAWQIAWIGLYPDVWSRRAVAGTSVILPPVSIALSLGQAVFGWFLDSMVILALLLGAISCVIAVFTWSTLKAISETYLNSGDGAEQRV